MSGAAKKPTSRDLKRTEFFERWKQKGLLWSAVLRNALEAVIENEALCMEARALAWMWLGSSGNHSLSVVNSDGIIQTQSDFARRIGALDENGKPDRRRVNSAFRLLKREGFYSSEGQELIPTEMFANSSPIAEGFPTTLEEEANVPLFPSFESWLHDRIAHRSPDDFKVYVEARGKVKEFRTRWLKEWEHERHKMSKGGPTNDQMRPKAPRQVVGKPADTLSESPEHVPDASLLPLKLEEISGPSSSFFEARKAFDSYAKTDDDHFKTLLNETTGASPEQLVDVIRQRGALIPHSAKNRAAYLKRSVINAVKAIDLTKRPATPAAEDIPETAAQQVKRLQQLLRDFPNHDSAATWREDLRLLKQGQPESKPVQSEPKAKAQRAGQG